MKISITNEIAGTQDTDNFSREPTSAPMKHGHNGAEAKSAIEAEPASVGD